MGLSKQSTDVQIIQMHEWERVWSQNDYKTHHKDLMHTHLEYGKAGDEYKNLTKKVHPDFIYQKNNGGMTKEFAVIYSPVRASNGEPQVYDLNCWKLDKYKKWVEFNQTPEQKEEGKKRVMAVLSAIRSTLNI